MVAASGITITTVLSGILLYSLLISLQPFYRGTSHCQSMVTRWTDFFMLVYKQIRNVQPPARAASEQGSRRPRRRQQSWPRGKRGRRRRRQLSWPRGRREMRRRQQSSIRLLAPSLFQVVVFAKTEHYPLQRHASCVRLASGVIVGAGQDHRHCPPSLRRVFFAPHCFIWRQQQGGNWRESPSRDIIHPCAKSTNKSWGLRWSLPAISFVSGAL